MAQCKSCGASITWYLTKNGKRIPINDEWQPGGNIVIDDHDHAIVVKEDQPGFTGRTRHHSHFATCTHASQHRKG